MIERWPITKRNFQEIIRLDKSSERDDSFLLEIVEKSKTLPLRRLIAQRIIFEGEEFWRAYKERRPEFDKLPFRSEEEIAVIDGYCGEGEEVLKAEGYFYNREGEVAFGLFAVGLLDPSFKPDHPLGEKLQKDLKNHMSEVVVSLLIDPTGIDLLKGRLADLKVVWGKHYPLGLDEEDPEVFGFRKGIERYTYLYREALRLGAVPDRTLSSRLQRRLLNLKRGLKESDFFGLINSIFPGVK